MQKVVNAKTKINLSFIIIVKDANFYCLRSYYSSQNIFIKI